MNASLDTNVIIHLYNTDLQSILFNRFEKLLVHEFIRNIELKNHASTEVLKLFDKDIEEGKIQLISDEYLKSIGMQRVFEQHIKDMRILYDPGDLGEVYGISLAKTLGCVALVTDDIKERGPHYTLMRTPDSDVIPFAFYEILFLDYLQGKTTEVKLLNDFKTINETSELGFNCSSKLKTFMRRFWKEPYTESEKQWMKAFCDENGINAKTRIMKLIRYLNLQEN